mgnify:CR=1 FL=1
MQLHNFTLVHFVYNGTENSIAAMLSMLWKHIFQKREQTNVSKRITLCMFNKIGNIHKNRPFIISLAWSRVWRGHLLERML